MLRMPAQPLDMHEPIYEPHMANMDDGVDDEAVRLPNNVTTWKHTVRLYPRLIFTVVCVPTRAVGVPARWLLSFTHAAQITSALSGTHRSKPASPPLFTAVVSLLLCSIAAVVAGGLVGTSSCSFCSGMAPAQHGAAEKT